MAEDNRGLQLFIAITIIYSIPLANGASNCPSKCICNETAVNCVERELTVIPDFKKVINNPTTLDLSGNDIEEVKTANFFSSKLVKLESLYLSDNSVLDIEVTAFSALINLQYLDLSNNLLEDIPSHAIQRNKKLEELNLSGNLFSSKTPELISTSLKILDLSFSKISVFTESNLKELPSLRVLYLHANSLKHVDYNIFVDVKLQHVDLSYNCWKCNCETIKLFDYLVKADLTEIDRPIQCMHPNKWYEDIYNSKGPMHHNKLCKKRVHHAQHNGDSVKPEVQHKENATRSQVAPPVHNTPELKNKMETELDSEDFTITMRYELIIGGTIVIVLALFTTIVLRIVISKSKKPKYNIYEELMENGITSSKVINADGFMKSNIQA